MGLAAVALGAGRERTDSVIDPAVGFTLEKKVGEPVTAGDALVTVHHRDGARLGDVLARLERAYRIGPAAPAPRPLILERIS